MFQGKNFINGNWSTDQSSFESINPSTEEVYGVFPNSNEVTIRSAVDAARTAFKTWKLESRVYRADLFDSLAQLIKRDHDKLKETISVETGKNLNESHAEVVEALHMCQVAAASGREPFGQCIASELSTKDAYVVRKPRGVIAVISPWNFPAAIGSFWSSAPALVEGNCVVHKPSELTPMVNQMITELYEEAGFPPGVFNLVHGDGGAGASLVRSDVDVILFTGSAEVGQDIRKHCADTHSKTCSIECGSKSATIVFEDGDLNLAVEACFASAFKLTGQRCVSSSRLLIQRNIVEDFCDIFAKKVFEEAKYGDPFAEPSPMFGPVISSEQRQKIAKFNRMAIDDGVLIRNYSDSVPTKGFFIPPFVYQAEWDRSKPYLSQEVFGPHVAIVPFDNLDDAIRIYNDTDYGLALGAITDDYRKHRKLAQECTTGMLYINGGSIAAESHLPFSSWKKSGYGASAAATYKAVTHTMAMTVNYEDGKVSWAQGMK